MQLTKNRLSIVSNTFFQLVGRVITSGTTFIVSIILARSLGVDGYGDFTKVTTFVAFFYLFVDFGLNAAFLKLQEDHSPPTLFDLFALRTLMSVVGIIFCLSILLFLPFGTTQGYTQAVRIGIIFFSLSILFHAVITTTNAVFQKNLIYARATIALFSGSTITLLMLFANKHISLFFSLFSMLAGTIVATLVAMALSFFALKGLPMQIKTKPMKKLFLYALPFSVTLIFNLIYFRADTIILTLSRSTAEVGIYNLAYKIFELPLVFPIFFMNAVYPLFLQEHIKHKERFIHHIKLSAAFLVSVSFVGVAVLWIGSSYIVLIKDAFAPSVGALRILSLGLPAFFLSSLTMWSLITMGKQKTLAVIYGISMIANIATNALLIPRFGIAAAAWATVFGEYAIVFISAIFLYSLTRKSSFVL